MELLGAYASDDEEPTPPAVAVAAPSSHTKQQETSPGRSRRRQLDLSILPQHIQDLLTGKGGDDSDSEDDQRHKRQTTHSGGTSRSEKRDLLGMLPRPSQAANREVSSSIASRLPDDSQAAFSRLPEQTVDFTFPKNSDFKASYTSEPESHSSFSFVEEPALPSFKSLPRKSAAPSLHREEVPSGLTSSDIHNVQESSIISREFTRSGESSRKRTRREERDIERSLLSGDMSRLSGAAFVEVHGKQPWDSTAYDERLQKEAEVLGVYNFGGKGGDKAIM